MIRVGVARAMMYLHEHDIIHRDLKTGNVWLDDNFEPHVAEFGLDKLSPKVESFNQTNIFEY